MDFNLSNKNDPWELSLYTDDSDLHLTPVLRPSVSICVEPSLSTSNPVRIIPGPAGIVQAAKLLKQRDILLGLDRAVMSTQEYLKKVVENVDFKSGAKLDQVVSIVKSCSPNAIGDLTMNIKDLSVFSPKPSMHYLNITMRNVVKVFRKDTIPDSGSG
nr:hypothetical protein [Tanacetum cinerariifolium]